jgi:hypothetical protein
MLELSNDDGLGIRIWIRFIEFENPRKRLKSTFPFCLTPLNRPLSGVLTRQPLSTFPPMAINLQPALRGSAFDDKVWSFVVEAPTRGQIAEKPT